MNNHMPSAELALSGWIYEERAMGATTMSLPTFGSRGLDRQRVCDILKTPFDQPDCLGACEFRSLVLLVGQQEGLVDLAPGRHVFQHPLAILDVGRERGVVARRADVLDG